MDLNTFLRGAMPTLASNATTNATRDRLQGGGGSILDSLMPLLSLGGRSNPLLQFFMLFQNVGAHLGFDPTQAVAVCAAIWAIYKVSRQVYSFGYGIVNTYYTANVHINSGDEMYLHVMKFLAGKPSMANSRALMAETMSKTAWEGEDEADVVATRISADGSGVYLNFSNQEAKAPPRFIPALGTHGFWHEGRYYRLHRKQESLYDEGSSSGQMPQFKDKERLVISTYGRSPEPIKELLQFAKAQYYNDHHAMTVIKRPSPQNVRRYGGRHAWVLVANRPVRPMKTVVLDPKQKVQVLTDINEYLHPATPRWYANRGIPLRRGYLFHGPPGTGKTSLSFALAGVFGLDIYVISLLEPSLTEEDLSALFNTLPRRCVVLLEDIDTAGLSRREEDSSEPSIEDSNSNNTTTTTKGRSSKSDKQEKSSSSASDPNNWKVSDLARELRKTPAQDAKKEGISLSGLLNAIDGVASHEGRVLIMTTNKPESLDDALIRPGRVDLQVAFTNATTEQAKELFERMYEADKHRHPELVKGLTDNDNSLSHSPLSPRQNGHVVLNGSAVLEATTASSPPSESAVPEKQPLLLHNEQQQQQQPTASQNGSVTSPTTETAGTAQTAAAAEKVVQTDERFEITQDDLSRIAGEFARKIPDGRFSPAEIQGFLLKRKKNPRKALEEVDAWIEAMVRLKDSRTKVMAVQ